MYLETYDRVVREKCKQHKSIVMNNRSILFDSPATRFSDIYNVETPKPQFVPSYNSGFSQTSSVAMNEIDVYNHELKKLRNELIEMTTFNNTLKEQIRQQHSELGFEQMLASIQSARRQRINEARNRDAQFTDDTLAFIETQSNRFKIIEARYKEVLDQKIRFQVKDELKNLNRDTLLEIYRRIDNRGVETPIPRIAQSSKKDEISHVIVEYLMVNNMIGNILSGQDENIEVNLHLLTSEDDDVFDRVLRPAPYDRTNDDTIRYPQAPPRPPRLNEDPMDDVVDPVQMKLDYEGQDDVMLLPEDEEDEDVPELE